VIRPQDPKQNAAGVWRPDSGASLVITDIGGNVTASKSTRRDRFEELITVHDLRAYGTAPESFGARPDRLKILRIGRS
jgi:hypothetical protein